MKAKLMKDGMIRIKTETVAEGYALNHLLNLDKKVEDIILFDNSILDSKKKKDKSDTVTER